MTIRVRLEAETTYAGDVLWWARRQPRFAELTSFVSIPRCVFSTFAAADVDFVALAAGDWWISVLVRPADKSLAETLALWTSPTMYQVPTTAADFLALDMEVVHVSSMDLRGFFDFEMRRED